MIKTNNNNTKAPDAALKKAKLEGPIEFDVNANLVKTEFAAKAVITVEINKNNFIRMIIPNAKNLAIKKGL